MALLALHGTTIELLTSGFQGRQPIFPLKLAPGSGAPDLRVELTFADAPGAIPDGAEAIFYHGLTRVYRHGDDLYLIDEGSSILRLPSDGRTIEGRITALSLKDEYSFTHATLFIALVLALRHRRLFHLHAGAVENAGRVILIPGASGNGKSSTTMALVAAGWSYVGDDAVLLRAADPIEILAVPKLFHLDDRSFGAFADIGLELGPSYRSNHQKRSLDPSSVFGAQLRTRAPAPTHLLFPTVRDRDRTAITPISQAEAFGALVESAPLFMFDGLANRGVQQGMLAAMATSSVAFQLDLGRDALSDRSVIPRLIEAL